jgi:hypothetical protein
MPDVRIYPHLRVGGDDAYERLKDEDNWSFLRCCKYGDGGHQQTLGYTTLGAPDGPDKYWVRCGHRLALNLLDLDDPNFIPEQMIFTGLEFVKQELEAGREVLISCNAGLSRGPTVGLMFLRYIGDLPHAYLHSVRLFYHIYRQYRPSQGIEQFARNVWSQLGDIGKASNGLGTLSI